MGFIKQLRGFLRGLSGDSQDLRSEVDSSLARTANDMRYVNRSVEDDRLDVQSTKNYTSSFKKPR